MARADVKSVALSENEIPLRAKYLTRNPTKRTKPKGDGNKGGVGRAARAEKRGTVVSGRNSPEQWGQYKSYCEKNKIKILG